MTRENAIKIVEKKLNAAGLGEAIKISKCYGINEN